MKIVRWVALFTGVTLLWTFIIVGGMFVFNDLNGAEAEPLPTHHRVAVELRDAEVTAPAPCCTEIPLPLPPEEELPVLHRPARQDDRTAVQQAPSFFNECFGEATQDRSRCRRLFNRMLTETELMHRYRSTTPGLPEITRLVLGRIILSEVNWLHDDRLDHAASDDNHAEIDAPYIYQVFRHTRMRGETLLGVMRRHSPHVSEVREVPRGHPRMQWVTELQLSCDRPAHFEQTDRQGNPLNWDRDYRPRCEALFTYAQRLLDGQVNVDSSAPVVTWGGRCETAEGACDDHMAEDRGLVPFETGDTANRFWCRPGAHGCPAPSVAEEPATTADGTVVSETELVTPT